MANLVGDRPISGYRVLERRTTLAMVAVLVGLAGLAWWSTVRQADDMEDMALGIGQVGARMPADMSAPVFLGMWVAMMAAMMLPTIGPIVLLHRDVTRRRGQPPTSSIFFVAGYLASWAAAGVVPLGVYLWFRELSADAGDSRWLPTLAGVTLAVAGAYQFTRWKAACARACRSPMSFLMTHDFDGGSNAALRAGAAHGLWCLGCCWALMAVLVVVGLMNLVWMVAIALVFLAEKHWTHALVLARVVGVGLILLGGAIIVDNDVLATASGVDRGDPPADPMGEHMPAPSEGEGM